jgi:hypothetical protein
MAHVFSSLDKATGRVRRSPGPFEAARRIAEQVAHLCVSGASILREDPNLEQNCSGPSGVPRPCRLLHAHPNGRHSRRRRHRGCGRRTGGGGGWRRGRGGGNSARLCARRSPLSLPLSRSVRPRPLPLLTRYQTAQKTHLAPAFSLSRSARDFRRPRNKGGDDANPLSRDDDLAGVPAEERANARHLYRVAKAPKSVTTGSVTRPRPTRAGGQGKSYFQPASLERMVPAGLRRADERARGRFARS